MNDEIVNFSVSTALEGSDEAEVQQEIRRLFSDLRKQDVENIEFVHAGVVPKGSKAADPALVRDIAVSTAPLLFPKVLEFLHSWAMRREGRVVKIKIQAGDDHFVEGEFPSTMSPKEARQWIAAVSKGISKA